MNRPDAAIEQEFGRLLVGYDEALASGTAWDGLDRAAGRLDAEIVARLESVKNLLVALHQLWPRTWVDDVPSPPEH